MIDKQGKLFGKLNIIDLIVILLIVAVVALLGYKFMSNRDEGLNGGDRPVVYTVKVQGVEPEIYEFIKGQLPAQLMAADQMVDGQVVEVQGTPNEENLFKLEESPTYNTVTLKHREPATYDLLFTIEANVDTNGVSQKVGTQELRVGRGHVVKTQNFELDGGIIVGCEYPDEAQTAENAG